MPAPIKIDIDRMSHDGRGIGLHQGRVVMVSGALPPETVTVKIEQANSKLWQGEAIEVENISPNRVAPKCAHFEVCGGCQQQHMSHETQLEIKQNAVSDLLKRQGVSANQWQAPLVSSPFEYRQRARFHISKAGIIGFHEAKKNRVVAVNDCPVLHPKLNELFKLIRSDAPLEGILEIEVAVDDFESTGLKANQGRATSIEKLHQWASEHNLVVSEPLRYKAGLNTVHAAVGEFTQVNRSINHAMIQQAQEWLSLSTADRVLDLFCGNGNFSLALADSGASILGIEGSQKAIDRAISASKGLSGVSFANQDLFSDPTQCEQLVSDFAPNVVVLDPPRAGAEKLCRVLATSKGIGKILYVSCDPSTLSRDLRYFNESKWCVKKIGLIDMFPQTKHIETMVLLDRQK